MDMEARQRLKAFRNRAGLRSRDVAESLGMPASTYQKYEDRRQGQYLPLHMVAKLVLAFKPHGIEPAEVWTLADKMDVAAFHQAWAAMGTGATLDTPAEESAEITITADWPERDSGHRRHERWNPLPAKVGLNGKREYCVVKDISPGGARVLSDMADDLEEEAKVSFELVRFGQMAAQVVHLEGREIGLKFNRDVEGQVADWLAPMRVAAL